MTKLKEQEATPEKTELPKLRFRADQKSPTLDIGNSDYRRRFEAKDQPFEVKSEEELRLLRNTGHFVVAEEPATAKEETEAKAKKGARENDAPTSASSTTPASATKEPVTGKGTSAG